MIKITILKRESDIIDNHNQKLRQNQSALTPILQINKPFIIKMTHILK